MCKKVEGGGNPRVIMLVRHGDYQQWEYKEDNKKLTPSGKLQAKEAGEAPK